MVRTEIPTTYGQLVVGDIIYVGSDTLKITVMNKVPGCVIITARDQAGSPRNLTPAPDYPVKRQHRTN
jgi:hypothetical protein